MAEVSDLSGRHFKIPLGGGEVVEYTGATVRVPYADQPVPELVLRMSVGFGHQLAHLLAHPPLASWSDMVLSRTLEAAAAALSDMDALRCATREVVGVKAAQRMAALGELVDREPDLSAGERVAVIDAAARWLDEDKSGELARALLSAVCRSPGGTDQVYLALLRPTDGEVVPS
jgi:hypothetical protein